jgi:hypothetical protein
VPQRRHVGVLAMEAQFLEVARLPVEEEAEGPGRRFQRGGRVRVLVQRIRQVAPMPALMRQQPVLGRDIDRLRAGQFLHGRLHRGEVRLGAGQPDLVVVQGLAAEQQANGPDSGLRRQRQPGSEFRMIGPQPEISRVREHHSRAERMPF